MSRNWKHSEEAKRRIGKASMGNKYRLGTKQSKETRKKISDGNKGKIIPPWHRLKISEAHLGKVMVSGGRCWNWKGGVSKIDKMCRGIREYMQWRSDVFSRDKWICRTCGITGVYVTAHHIKSFGKIIRENNIKTLADARKCRELWDINNGITLCEDCHKLTDNYKGRGRIKSE